MFRFLFHCSSNTAVPTIIYFDKVRTNLVRYFMYYLYKETIIIQVCIYNP